MSNNYKEQLQQNNNELNTILATVNSLPEAGGGSGESTPYLKQLIERDPSITSFTIPDGITTIGTYVGAGWTSLTDLTVPNSVQYVGYSAFCDCFNLANLYISDLAQWCESITFDNTNLMENSCNLYLNNVLVTNLIIPDRTVAINSYAFRNCNSITSVTCPNSSYFTIGDYAFCNCWNLQSVVLPESLTVIPAYCFSGCQNLYQIDIPNRVTNINSYAFSYDTKLAIINFSDNITNIQDYAFYNTSPEYVLIPDSVTTIGARAFSCKAPLIIVGTGVSSIAPGAFTNSKVEALVMKAVNPPTLTGTSSIVSSGTQIYVPENSVDSYKSATNWSAFADRIKGWKSFFIEYIDGDTEEVFFPADAVTWGDFINSTLNTNVSAVSPTKRFQFNAARQTMYFFPKRTVYIDSMGNRAIEGVNSLDTTIIPGQTYLCSQTRNH